MGLYGVAVDLLMLEMSAPEFFWTHIGKVENAGSNCLRFYCCVMKGDALEPVFTCVMPIPEVIQAGNFATTIASKFLVPITVPSKAAH